jgi:acetyl esterase/lipase
MHHLPHLAKGPFVNLDLPRPDSKFIASLFDFAQAPAFRPPPASPQDWLNDRMKFGLFVFRENLTAEIMINGLSIVEGDAEARELPVKGHVRPADIDGISEIIALHVGTHPLTVSCVGPLQLCRKFRYPPVCQIIGAEDSLFDLSHVTDLAAVLQEQGIEHEEIVVEGADHAFDMSIKTGDALWMKVTVPAVDWVEMQCR